MDTGFYRKYFEVEKNHWLMRVRRTIIHDVVDSIYTKDELLKIKMLDYGSGSGFLVGEFQRKGIDARGVDMSGEAIEYGKSHGIKNLNVLNGNMKLVGNEYDIILAMDVLEHIENELVVFYDITKALKSGGYFIVTVPAYMFLWGVQDDIAHHYRRYTMTSLANLVDKSGDFVMVKKSYFNTFLFPAIMMIRLLSKIFKFNKRESDFDINNKFLNSIFYAIFNLESKFLRYLSFPFGVSILLVLKKK